MGTLIFNKSSVKLSAAAFLIPRFSFGVVCRGVPGVALLTGLGEGENAVDLNIAGVPSFNLVLANFLAAGDMVAKRSKFDVFGLGDGLETNVNSNNYN